MEKNSKKEISQEDMMALLDTCYDKSLNGIGKVSLSVKDMADDYLKKYDTVDEACKAMLKNQIIKCTTSGALSGLGGVITIPVTIPANIGSVLYMCRCV